jgi:ABC-type transport system involved in multi-copper enzyme maturation permease subunit
MIGSIAAELFMLRKKTSTWILLGIWFAIGTVFPYLIPYINYRNDDSPARANTLIELLPQGLIGTITYGFPFYGGAIALMLGVLTMGGDYNYGTLKTLYTQGPTRFQIFASRAIALAIMLIPFVIVSFIGGAISSVAIARIEDASTNWPSVLTVLEALGASWFLLGVWMAVGSLIAILTRSTALSIGIGLLWGFLIEGLVSLLLDSSDLFRPVIEFFLRANAYSLVRGMGGIVQSNEADGPGAFAGPFVDNTRALLVLSVYLIATLAGSFWVLKRRDVA